MSENSNSKDLICPHCGAVRHIDSNYEFIKCEFCGASERYIESDDVKIERLKSKTAREIASEQAARQQETELRKAEINNVSDSIKGGLQLIGKGENILGQGEQMINKAERFIRRIIFLIILGFVAMIAIIVLLVLGIRALF